MERDGNSVDWSPRELAILDFLVWRAGEAIRRDEILGCRWGLDYYPESRTLDQHVAKLRKLIELAVSAPAIIEAACVVGYRDQLGR